MAEESFISELKKQIGCTVCNNALFNPRDLPCKHSICNDCLDGLIVFQEDGSGSLQCPYGCEKIIKIGPNDSIGSLLSSTKVTLDILNFLKENKETNNSSCQNENFHCEEEACNSCSVCSEKNCNTCWETHTCESKTSYPVIYDERKDNFGAICKTHGSLAKSICIDCGNQFLCIYCMHREHKDHYKDTIENQAGVTKNRLSTEIENKIKAARSPISYKEELKKFGELRKNLEEELQERIIKRLNQYAVLLNQQKETILQTFDTKIVEYEGTLSKFGLIQKNYEETLSLYINELDTKPSFEIIAEKDEIMQKSEILSSLHCFMVSLTDYHVNEQAIGDLYVSNFKRNEIQEDEKIIDLIFKKSYKTDYELIDETFDLAKTIKELVISIKSSNKVFRRIKTHEYSFPDVIQLINDDRNDDLNVLLKCHPSIILLTDPQKKTLIHRTAEIGKNESLKCLLNSNNKRINVKDKYNKTALILASQYGYKPCAELLLQHNADINVTNEYGNTSLIIASMNGHESCVELLLQHTNDVNVQNKDGDSALILASETGHEACVELLLQQNADTNVLNEEGNTALMRASIDGHEACVELLLQHTTDVNVQNGDGDTALILASESGHKACVELLLQQNADTNNVLNEEGSTALMRASKKGHIACAELILQHNVNVTAKN